MNALSVDVEDWFAAIETIPFKRWPDYPSRINGSVAAVLRLLANAKRRATFFILGYEAERHPEVVRAIVQGGHEIATHGYSHRLIYRMQPEEFRRELRASISVLEGLSGQKVIGHRAPAWSITRDSLWALDILLEEGLRYDASISPVKTYLFGIPGIPPSLHRIREKEGRVLYEIPMSALKLGPATLPFVGGFFTRALPYPLIRWGMRRFNRQGWPVSVWMHPWDLDVGQPRIRLPLALRRHYVGLAGAERKIARLLSDFDFGPLCDILPKAT